MGLPDVGKANDVYVDMMSKAMKGVTTPNNFENMPTGLHGPGGVQAVPELHGRGQCGAQFLRKEAVGRQLSDLAWMTRSSRCRAGLRRRLSVLSA